LKLWRTLKCMDMTNFASDYRKSYEAFIPPGKYFQAKAGTYTVESYNRRIRHYLAGFKRKTKCYNTFKYMIIKYLNALMLKLNNVMKLIMFIWAYTFDKLYNL
jgi:insertion element IS1 protein InsB